MAEEMPPSKRHAFTPPAPVLPLAAPPLPLGFAQQTPNFWDMGSVDDDDVNYSDNNNQNDSGGGYGDGNGNGYRSSARRLPKTTTVAEFLSQSLERAAISDSYNGDSVSNWMGLTQRKGNGSGRGSGSGGGSGGGNSDVIGDEAPRLRPPTPLEVLQSAWEMVVAEKVVGSCTACVVSLDQHLNQLSYANLGDSGVMVRVCSCFLSSVRGIVGIVKSANLASDRFVLYSLPLGVLLIILPLFAISCVFLSSLILWLRYLE